MSVLAARAVVNAGKHCLVHIAYLHSVAPRALTLTLACAEEVDLEELGDDEPLADDIMPSGGHDQ